MKRVSNYWLNIGVAAVCAVSMFRAGAADLPSKVCFSVANPGLAYGDPSYFDATLQRAGGPQLFDAWCIAPEVMIVYGPIYTAQVLTPAAAAAEGLIVYPENLDLVLYVLNQNYPGKSSPSGGKYTFGEVQRAIWTLIDDVDPSFAVDLGEWVQARVDEILADALANGEGFQPQCNGKDIMVLKPVAEGCHLDTTQTEPICQLIIIEVPIPCSGPGTGTPGYWAKATREWPVDQIVVGGITYTKAEAIAMMKRPVRGDKRWTLFPALVAAKLNVLIGNESSCVADTIAQADAWWAAYGANPVPARSEAWMLGEPLYRILDNYNNGSLCAPPRY